MQSAPMFRASEILQMAIEIERSGLAFYEACVQAASDGRVAEVFQFMAGEEKKHIEIFGNMEEPLAHYELPQTHPRIPWSPDDFAHGWGIRAKGMGYLIPQWFRVFSRARPIEARDHP